MTTTTSSPDEPTGLTRTSRSAPFSVEREVLGRHVLAGELRRQRDGEPDLGEGGDVDGLDGDARRSSSPADADGGRDDRARRATVDGEESGGPPEPCSLALGRPSRRTGRPGGRCRARRACRSAWGGCRWGADRRATGRRRPRRPRVEREDVVHRDEVAFHADHLGDLHDAPGAVAQAAEVHDQVDRRRHLLADRPERAGRARS